MIKMKKLLVALIVSLVSRFSFADPSNIGTQPPSAGWNFGNVTYGQEGGSLVLNSLSDRYGVSTFQTANTNGQATQLLGTNDYIEENAVKNQLAIDGYTVAYDNNPQYTGLYASEYNQPLPTNVPLTELSFEGLAGDPTAIQNVYVPTSEYNALSAQGQAASISALNSGLATTNNNAFNTSNPTSLQSQINNTNASLAGTQNMTDNSVITNTVKTNTANIATLGTGLAQTNAQVNTNTANIGALNTGLNNETLRAQGAESGLQNQINQIEKVKVMADMTVRILDEKKYTVGFFDMWDGTNNRNFAFGARLTYKLGKSYEERLVEKQQKQIEDLQRILTKIADQK
jgi:hypothetical protein